MFTHNLKKLPKSTVEIAVDIPKSTIKDEYGKAFERIRSVITIQGFRQGKAPKDVVEKQLKKETVYEELMKDLMPKIYQEIVNKESLKPIISPRIELLKAEEDEDWQIRITVAEKPQVELGDYKKKIQELKKDSKKQDIWIPGSSSAKATEGQEGQNDEQKKQRQLNEILALILKEVKAEVPDIIIEEELNKRLSQLVDDVQKIGLTIESYLKSKNLTMDQLKAQYSREIEDMYKLEFILLEIADKEGITVEQAEIEKLFGAIKDEKEKAAAQANSYFYASILRKQKTLDFLGSL